MSTYNDDKSYASSGVGGAALGLGIAGTALGLGLLNGNGLFNNRSSTSDEICQLRTQNAILTSENSTDKKLVDVYTELRRQDKDQDAKINALDSRVAAIEVAIPLKDQLVQQQITCCCNSANTAIAALQNTVNNLTKTVIPNSSVCPGWGDVTITPKAG